MRVCVCVDASRYNRCVSPMYVPGSSLRMVAMGPMAGPIELPFCGGGWPKVRSVDGSEQHDSSLHDGIKMICKQHSECLTVFTQHR